MRNCITFIAAFSCALCTSSAHAQGDYPAKPIRIVIGTPAGGGSDLMARLVGQRLTQAWNAVVVVEPRPGVGGNIAAELVAKSAPDGYTLYVCYGTHTVNPNLYAKLGYDAIRDFAPVTLLARQYNALVVHPSVPARSVNELVALAQKNPGKLSYASSGSGSPTHLGMELFKIMAKIDLTHIPYKGAAPSRIDLLGGHIDLMFDVLRTALPYHEAGRIRMLAVASRAALAAGAGSSHHGGSGLERHRGPHLARVARARRHPASHRGAAANGNSARPARARARRTNSSKDGVEVVASTPAELETFMRADMAKWGGVIKTARIQAD